MEIDKALINEFVEALLSGNKYKCSEIVNNLVLSNFRIEDIYEELLRIALYKVGELWEMGKITVAAEHLSTAIVEGILNELYYKLISSHRTNRTVVVACVENEYHQVGIKMVADIFEMYGWNSHFLGANTPSSELINYMKAIKPDILALSLSIYFHTSVLEKMLNEIRVHFPEILIIIGGQAFRHGAKNIFLNFKNTIYFENLYNLEEFIKRINANG